MRALSSFGSILMNKGPWGNGSGNNSNGSGKNPWGDKPPRKRTAGSQGGDSADLEAVLREAQNRFRSFGGGGNGGGLGKDGKSGLGLLFIGLLLLWMASGVYRIQPSEHGVILTFGKYETTRTQAGLGYHLPWPLQALYKVDVARDRRIMIGFSDVGYSRNNLNQTEGIPSESLMVTGDENIINIHFVVLWHINDAKNYLFAIREPENTIKKVAESAMREIIGRSEIQKALTEARADIEVRTRALMQEILDEYESGILVDSVQLQNVNPPDPVVDAFDDVQRAKADKERLKNEAETYANDVIPKARGESQKMLQAAEAYKQSVINKAEGDAQRFESVYAAYRQAKDVTEKRIYIETIEDILRKSNKIIVGEGGAPVLPYMSLDKLKQAAK
ncbi:MAG: FtsH protease activity modulator HflK [Alphaproteobacteria bacterium]|nr:FtsH protease activity modulator HflK [Alphaproteobacteria bacterium]